MPTFTPVHVSARGRLVLSFGDEQRPAVLVCDDALERLINRCAVNELVISQGCDNAHQLDQLCHQRLIVKKPGYGDRDFHYFTGLANGKTPLRKRSKRGRPGDGLLRYLAVLDDSGSALHEAVQWNFWELIHPAEIGHLDLDLHMMGGAAHKWNGIEFHRLCRLAKYQDIPVEQHVAEIQQVIEQGQLKSAIAALWHGLRGASINGQLLRYALLYELWLNTRRHLEQSPTFARLVEPLYCFAATWFGQVDVFIDPAMNPLGETRAEYFRTVRSTLELLGVDVGKAMSPEQLWSPFHLNGSSSSMQVCPRAYYASFGLPVLKGRVSDLSYPEANLYPKARPLPAVPSRPGLNIASTDIESNDIESTVHSVIDFDAMVVETS